MIAKAECPRCRKKVAVKSRSSDGVTLFRHKDEDGLWCPGTPKSHNELVLDLFYVLRDKENLLREYGQELIRHSEAIIALSERVAANTETVTAVLQQATDALRTELAQRA